MALWLIDEFGFNLVYALSFVLKETRKVDSHVRDGFKRELPCRHHRSKALCCSGLLGVRHDGTDVSSVQNAAVGFKHFGRRNEESIAKLFVTLLIKLSAVKTLWRGGLCASVYEGTWIQKKWGSGNMNVEDFLDRSQNFARAVGKEETEKIYKCIRDSLRNLSRFMEGHMEEAKLKDWLFRSTIPIVIDEPTSRKRSNPLNNSTEVGPTAAKKARHVDAMEVRRHDVCMHPNDLASDPPMFPLQPLSAFGPQYTHRSSFLHHGYRSEYNTSLPHQSSVLDLGHQHRYDLPPPAAPYRTELPFEPRSDYETRYNLPPPAAAYFGIRPEYRSQVLLPSPLGHGIEQHEQSFARNYLPNRDLLFLGNDNLPSRYSSQGPQRQFLRPGWGYGPDYR